MTSLFPVRLALLLALAAAGCESPPPSSPRPDTAALRLALTQETLRRLDPVHAAVNRIWSGRSDSLADLKTAWRSAVLDLRQDVFPQSGSGLMFECFAAFQSVEADFEVQPTVSRLRTCRDGAATMAAAAGKDSDALAWSRVEQYAVAGLRALGAREAASGSRDLAAALEREGASSAGANADTGLE